MPIVALAVGVSMLGCAPHRGEVEIRADGAFALIQAGSVPTLVGVSADVKYVVDPATELCFFYVRGVSMTQVDCCAVRRVADARPFVSWEDDASCTARRFQPRSGPPAGATSKP